MSNFLFYNSLRRLYLIKRFVLATVLIFFSIFCSGQVVVKTKSIIEVNQGTFRDGYFKHGFNVKNKALVESLRSNSDAYNMISSAYKYQVAGTVLHVIGGVGLIHLTAQPFINENKNHFGNIIPFSSTIYFGRLLRRFAKHRTKKAVSIYNNQL